MTGLDVDNDVIIEIFCLITNGNLELLDEEGWGTVVHQSKERMDAMVSTIQRFFKSSPHPS
jgi:oligoribonuclease